MISKMLCLAIALVLAPLAGASSAMAQQPARVHHIALLDYSAPAAERQEWWNAFHRHMRELGYVEGQNVSFDARGGGR
jgi:hypothetical protein